MIIFLMVLQAVLVLGVVLFSFGFLFASLNEKEPRAALITGAVIVSLIFLELFLYWIYSLGFFFNPAGKLLLLAGWAGVGYGIYYFGRHTGDNDRALEGVDGYIVGNARRFDERESVFARERSIRPGSAEYDSFYSSHPELEQMDSERRTAGGLLGTPGAIDRPGELPNVSAMEAFSEGTDDQGSAGLRRLVALRQRCERVQLREDAFDLADRSLVTLAEQIQEGRLHEQVASASQLGQNRATRFNVRVFNLNHQATDAAGDQRFGKITDAFGVRVAGEDDTGTG